MRSAQVVRELDSVFIKGGRVLDESTASGLIADLALGGDICERAAARLHQLLVPPLRGYFVRRYRASEADAEDAASSAVLHLFELATGEDPPKLPDRSAAGWLWRVACNAGVDELRRIWRRRGPVRVSLRDDEPAGGLDVRSDVTDLSSPDGTEKDADVVGGGGGHGLHAVSASPEDLDWLDTCPNASDLDPLVRHCLERQWREFWVDNPVYANVFERAVLDGWSKLTISEALGRSVHATEQLISQATKRLFAYMSRCID